MGTLGGRPDDLLTITEAALIMRCSTRTVSNLAHEHGIGFNLRGQAGWRFTRGDVDKLMASRKVAKSPVIADRRRRRREQRSSGAA